MPSETKVLLVSPNYRESDIFSAAYFPVGLGYLAESLRTAGIAYEVVDLNVETVDHLYHVLNACQPEFFAIGMMSYRCSDTYRLVEEVKQRHPTVKVIAGGPHLTTNREKVLADCPSIDYGFLGESERTLVAFLEGRPLSGISGILYRDRDRILATADREFITDLDAVPFPTYQKFKMEKYSRSIPIHSSRGCPYKCIFCGGPLILGRRWRARSAGKMVEELIYWYDRGYRSFQFSDSNLGMDKKRIVEFCDRIIDRGLTVSLSAEGIRGDHFDRPTFLKMRQAGFSSLAIGIESGSDTILANLKKGATIRQLGQTVDTAVELGFEVNLFFIIGSPGEGVPEIRESFRFALRYDIAKAYFFTMTPIPGTEFYGQAVEAGYIDDMRGHYPEGNFGFSNTALLPTGVLAVNQLNPWIRRARRLERQIDVKHLLTRRLHADRSAVARTAIRGLSSFFSLKYCYALFQRMIAIYVRLPKRFHRGPRA